VSHRKAVKSRSPFTKGSAWQRFGTFSNAVPSTDGAAPLPTETGPRACLRTELSLHTKELELARTIAAEVTLASHRLLPGLKTKMISSADAEKILVQVALEHSVHLDSVMATRQTVDRDPDAGRRGGISTGWTLRLNAAQGDRAELGPTEERELRAAGLDEIVGFDSELSRLGT
jgi:hypothetical protein